MIVVEHDETTIRESDFVIDLGPGAGEHGGHVVYAGDVPGLIHSRESLTGQYLRGELTIRTPSARRHDQLEAETPDHRRAVSII